MRASRRKKYEDVETQRGKKEDKQTRNLELNSWKPPAAVAGSSLRITQRRPRPAAML